MKYATFALVIVTIFSLTMGLLSPVVAEDGRSPQEIICENIDDPACDDAGEGTVSDITQTVLNVLSVIIGVASVLVLIIAGFMQVVSAGNSDVIKRSRNAIIYALIGLVVVIFAQAIVQFVLSSV